ncbi:hypothetical protein MCP1_110050 [Candidatus Terasakiella magnetica]|nr:hypothetical protein MCP1_110050 [Candidatus Terasakiella magnetica]
MHKHSVTGELVQNYDGVTGPDGTWYPATWPKGDLDFLVLVSEAPPPSDPNVVVTGFHVGDDNVQVWETRPKTRDEINGPLLAQIAALDASSTRPLRAVLAAQAVGTDPDPADVERLVDLNAQAAALRSRLVR